jgi:eukaryotic-like serine/threonine-protein kinase
MSLAVVGTRLGPYESVSELGSGGMGKVYRARDTRLGREVAIKLLPAEAASDAARLKRFEKEARAASALNHPNIVTIYAVDCVDSTTFIVMELVEGKTLREILADWAGGPLPTRKLLPIASQIADGLARAHACGIVHRDLKPENIMVTADGLVKILDFGLAKLAHPERERGQPVQEATVSELTAPGIAMGTVGYMSPEQAAGQPVDFHSDQFSFGSVLYEMVTGRRAFQGNTAPETLAAIIREEPEPIASLAPKTPASLRWILERCLAKEPKERYTSTEDLSKDLQSLQLHLSELSTPSGGVTPLPTPRRRARLATALVAFLILLGVLAGLLLGRHQGKSSPPLYSQITLKSGFLSAARFAPDSQTILYSAAWGGDRLQGFIKRPETPDAVPLGPPGAAVLAVSPSGEIALALDCKESHRRLCTGTLAKAPLAGGSPRELYEHIQQADWTPDGSALAVVRDLENKSRLESPPGKLLYETGGYVSDPRFSPSGDAIAFFDHPLPNNDMGSVAVVNLSGKKQVLTSVVEAAGGLAWSPSGKEIWFSANVGDGVVAINAVTLSGKQRLIARAPGLLQLHDVSRDGRALVSQNTWEWRVLALAPGETAERDLTWLRLDTPESLSRDGKTLLFVEGQMKFGYAACLRRTDGSPVVRLGDGIPMSLSSDGKWALVRLPTAREPYVLLPTGVGEPRRIVYEGIEEYGDGDFLADGKEILFLGRRGKDIRFYRGSSEGGKPRPATPPAVGPFARFAVSSDSRRLLARSNGTVAVYSLDAPPETPPRPVPGTSPADVPIQWSDDGRSVYLQNSARVFSVDVETGRRTLWKEIVPSDPSGATIGRILVTPDGRSYAYQLRRDLSQLYLVEGLK